MSQGPPPQLKEFIRNAGVKVVQQAPPLPAPTPAPAPAPKRPITEENFNFNNIVSPRSDLQLRFFHAKVQNIARPEDVVRYVRELRLSSEAENDIKVIEVSGHYGQMQTGLKRSINFNYETKLNPLIKNASPTWTYVQFKFIVQNEVTVIVKVYKNLMLIQGEFVPYSENTPYKVANHVLNRYLGGQTMVDKTLQFSYVEGQFQISKQFNATKMNKWLSTFNKFVKTDLGVTRVNPKQNQYNFYGNEDLKNVRSKKSKNAFYDFRRLGQSIIYSISGKGVVKLRGETIEEVKGKYATAKKIIDEYILGPGAPTENFGEFAEFLNESPKRKKRKTAVAINVNAAITNMVIGKKKCSDYSMAQMKLIAKVLGIEKKHKLRNDLCRTIDNVLKGRREAVKAVALLPGNVENLRKQNLYKKRGINDASISDMLRKAKSTNVARDLREIKKRFPTLKANKKEGVPFLGGVRTAVKNVVREQEIRRVVNKYTSLNQNTRNRIFDRVKKMNVGAANIAIKRNIQIAQLNVSPVVKNKLYEELKNKKNTNVKEYARIYKLIEEYSKGFRNSVYVRKDVLAWLRTKNTLPNNDSVKAKVLQVMKRYDDTVTKNLLNARYTKSRNAAANRK